ncbi:MAG: methylenetetrahydrofolate reductase [Eubacterium ramulus]
MARARGRFCSAGSKGQLHGRHSGDAAHCPAVTATGISMHSTLLGATYQRESAIRVIVTGDPVPSGERGNTKSVFDFNSIRFMEYINELNQDVSLQDSFSYGGALNQNLANTDKVIERMQKKIDAGVSWFMTQPIYSDEEVEKLARMKRELDTKILCGIMPLVSYRNAMFIKNEMPGIHVPMKS